MEMVQNNTLLLVEDDENLGKGLQAFLQQEGFICLWQKNTQGIEHNWYSADLVILDRQLNDSDSLSHLPQWLAMKALPVIILTAYVEISDRIAGLEAGARDYLTKPFSHSELLARIRAQLRTLGDGCLHSGALSLFPARQIAHWHEQSVALSPTEFSLLSMLVQREGRIFTRDELLNQVWGYQHFPSTRTVDTHILQLRQKLPGIKINTVRGVGYYLEPS